MEQITAGSQVQLIHFLSIQSFTLASFIMCAVAELIYGLVSVLCIHISRQGEIAPSHLTLWTTAQMLSKEMMCWTLSQQSLGRKQEFIWPCGFFQTYCTPLINPLNSPPQTFITFTFITYYVTRMPSVLAPSHILWCCKFTSTHPYLIAACIHHFMLLAQFCCLTLSKLEITCMGESISCTPSS